MRTQSVAPSTGYGPFGALGATRSKIRILPLSAPRPSEDFEQSSYSQLREAVDHIYKGTSPEPFSREHLYRTVEMLCTIRSNSASLVFSELSKWCEGYIATGVSALASALRIILLAPSEASRIPDISFIDNSQIDQLLRSVSGSSSSSSSSSSSMDDSPQHDVSSKSLSLPALTDPVAANHFFRLVQRLWMRHLHYLQIIRSVFLYLDRTLIHAASAVNTSSSALFSSSPSSSSSSSSSSYSSSSSSVHVGGGSSSFVSIADMARHHFSASFDLHRIDVPSHNALEFAPSSSSSSSSFSSSSSSSSLSTKQTTLQQACITAALTLIRLDRMRAEAASSDALYGEAPDTQGTSHTRSLLYYRNSQTLFSPLLDAFHTIRPQPINPNCFFLLPCPSLPPSLPRFHTPPFFPPSFPRLPAMCLSLRALTDMFVDLHRFRSSFLPALLADTEDYYTAAAAKDISRLPVPEYIGTCTRVYKSFFFFFFFFFTSTPRP